MKKPWDRRDDESASAHGAFLLYRDLGEYRTLEATVRELARPANYRRVLSRWAKQHEWDTRAAAWDAHLLNARDEVSIDAVAAAQRALLNHVPALLARLVKVSLGQYGTIEVTNEKGETQVITAPPATGAEVRALLGALDRAGLTVTRRVDHTSKGQPIGTPIDPSALSDAALAELAAQAGLDDEDDDEDA